MAEVAATPLPRSLPLLAAPHRVFFAAGMFAYLLLAIGWVVLLAPRLAGMGGWVSAVPEPVAHAAAMLAGPYPFFIFGFMYTAGPRWLNARAPERQVWLPGAVAALLGWLLAWLGMAAAATLAAVGLTVMAAGWLWLAYGFSRVIAISPVPDRRHAIGIAGGTAVAALAMLWLAAQLVGLLPLHRGWLALLIGGGLLPVFFTVCHRMIPFFTGSALPQVSPWRPYPLLLALYLASGLIGWQAAVGGGIVVGTVATLGALAAAALVWRWGVWPARQNRLLLMLHAALAWLPLSLALIAGDAWLSAGSLGLAPVHAAGLGLMQTMTMAMVTRVTRGHSGRPLQADNVEWLAYWGVHAAALARVAADCWPDAGRAWLSAALALWAVATVAWVWKLMPIYWRVRSDGQPG